MKIENFNWPLKKIKSFENAGYLISYPNYMVELIAWLAAFWFFYI